MKKRESNIELLRIVLMTMIVLWHFIVHGFLFNYSGGDDEYVHPLLNHVVMSILCCHVNCFIFISGYFGIKTDRKRIISFLTMTTFYGVFTFLLLLGITRTFDIEKLFQSLVPLCGGMWWFFTDYFFLMLLAPFINEGMDCLSHRKVSYLLVCMFALSVSGMRFLGGTFDQSFLFLFIYMLGRFLRKYPNRIFEKNAVCIWLFSVVSIAGMFVCQRYFKVFDVDNIAIYHNPLCISAAIGLFYCFKRMTIPCNSFLNKFSSGVFGAYLLTDGSLRYYFNYYPVTWTGGNLLYLFPIALFFVMIGATFELFRKKIMSRIDVFIYDKLKNV